MEIREYIARNHSAFVATTSAAIIVAAVFCYAQLRSGGRPVPPKVADKAFFTTDDGATLFADSIDRIVPFDRDGKEAVRAYVFSCTNGQHQWVQYLEKLSGAGLKQMNLSRTNPGTVDLPAADLWLVKKPGDAKWIARGNSRSREIQEPKAPEGCDPASIDPVDPS